VIRSASGTAQWAVIRRLTGPAISFIVSRLRECLEPAVGSLVVIGYVIWVLFAVGYVQYGGAPSSRSAVPGDEPDQQLIWPEVSRGFSH